MQTVAKRLQHVRRITLNDPIFIKLGVSFAFWVQRPDEQVVILTRGPRDEPVREVNFTLGEQEDIYHQEYCRIQARLSDLK